MEDKDPYQWLLLPLLHMRTLGKTIFWRSLSDLILSMKAHNTHLSCTSNFMVILKSTKQFFGVFYISHNGALKVKKAGVWENIYVVVY